MIIVFPEIKNKSMSLKFSILAESHVLEDVAMFERF